MSKRALAPSMDGEAWVLLLILSVVWGGSFYFFKILTAELPPLTIVLGRVGLAALALNLLLWAQRDPMKLTPRLWREFIVLGVLNNVIPFTLIAFGEARISSGLASILNAATPIFAVLVAHVATADEKLTWPKAIGVAFGFAGVAVLLGAKITGTANTGGAVGEWACLGAAFVYAFGGVYARRFRGLPPLKVATGQVTASTLVLVPLSLIVDRPWNLAPPSAAAFSAWVGIALLCTAFAFILYFRILAKAGATNVMLVTLLVPVSALLLGAAFLGERITGQSLAGMAMIAIGLAAIDGRAWRAMRTRLA